MKPNFTKSIAIITLACFVLSSVMGQAISSTFEINREAAKTKEIFDDFVMPHTAGRITGGKCFGTKEVVINIQDLHCHSEVQKNIGRMLSILDEKYGLPNVYLEGAIGDVDTSWLTSIDNVKLRQKIIDTLVEQGKLTGAEYYSVMSNRPGVIKGLEERDIYTSNLKRLGQIIEKQADVKNILSSLESDLNPVKDAYYNAKQKKLEKISEKYRQDRIDARKYFKLVERYCKRLDIDIYSYVNVMSYLNLMELEKELNYKRITGQLQELVIKLKQKLPYNVYNTLLNETENFSKTDILYPSLIKIAKNYNLNLSGQYSELNKFFIYVDASANINPVDLVSEEKKLIKELNIRLSQNQSERDIVFLVDFYGYLRDYFTNKISAEDYEYFTANLDDFKIFWLKYIDNENLDLLNPYIDLFAQFYKANVERNNCFVKNIFPSTYNLENPPVIPLYERGKEGDWSVGADLSAVKGSCPFMGDDVDVNSAFSKGADKSATTEQTADESATTTQNIINSLKDSQIKVVIAGGFHTSGLVQLLEQKKISYLVITPNVTQDTKFSDAVYTKRAKEQNKIFFQTIALLNLSQNPDFIRAQEASDAVLRAYILHGEFTKKEAIDEIKNIFKRLKKLEEDRTVRKLGEVDFSIDERDEKYFVKMNYDSQTSEFIYQIKGNNIERSDGRTISIEDSKKSSDISAFSRQLRETIVSYSNVIKALNTKFSEIFNKETEPVAEVVEQQVASSQPEQDSIAPVRDKAEIDELKKQLSSKDEDEVIKAAETIMSDVVDDEALRLEALKIVLPIVLPKIKVGVRPHEGEIDIHNHTNDTDGYSPSTYELYDRLIKGYKAIAITEHDLISQPEAEASKASKLINEAIQEYNKKMRDRKQQIPDFLLIPGIEITTFKNDIETHVIVLIPDFYENTEKRKRLEELIKKLDVLTNNKINGVKKLFDESNNRLKEFNVDGNIIDLSITWDDVEKVRRSKRYISSIVSDAIYYKYKYKYKKEFSILGINSSKDVWYNIYKREDIGLDAFYYKQIKKFFLKWEETKDFIRKSDGGCIPAHPPETYSNEKKAREEGSFAENTFKNILNELIDEFGEGKTGPGKFLGVEMYSPKMQKAEPRIQQSVSSVIGEVGQAKNIKIPFWPGSDNHGKFSPALVTNYPKDKLVYTNTLLEAIGLKVMDKNKIIPTLGYTFNEVVKIIEATLGIDKMQELAVEITKLLFSQIGKNVVIINGYEELKKLINLDELKNKNEEELKESDIRDIKSVEVVKGDFLPRELVGEDIIGFATLKVEDGLGIIYISEGFMKQLLIRAPPIKQKELLNLLIQHELDEYLALNVNIEDAEKILWLSNFIHYLARNNLTRSSESFHGYIKYLNELVDKNKPKNEKLLAIMEQIELIKFAEESLVRFSKNVVLGKENSKNTVNFYLTGKGIKEVYAKDAELMEILNGITDEKVRKEMKEIFQSFQHSYGQIVPSGALFRDTTNEAGKDAKWVPEMPKDNLDLTGRSIYNSNLPFLRNKDVLVILGAGIWNDLPIIPLWPLFTKDEEKEISMGKLKDPGLENPRCFYGSIDSKSAIRRFLAFLDFHRIIKIIYKKDANTGKPIALKMPKEIVTRINGKIVIKPLEEYFALHTLLINEIEIMKKYYLSGLDSKERFKCETLFDSYTKACEKVPGYMTWKSQYEHRMNSFDRSRHPYNFKEEMDQGLAKIRSEINNLISSRKELNEKALRIARLYIKIITPFQLVYVSKGADKRLSQVTRNELLEEWGYKDVIEKYDEAMLSGNNLKSAEDKLTEASKEVMLKYLEKIVKATGRLHNRHRFLSGALRPRNITINGDILDLEAYRISRYKWESVKIKELDETVDPRGMMLNKQEDKAFLKELGETIVEKLNLSDHLSKKAVIAIINHIYEKNNEDNKAKKDINQSESIRPYIKLFSESYNKVKKVGWMTVSNGDGDILREGLVGELIKDLEQRFPSIDRRIINDSLEKAFADAGLSTEELWEELYLIAAKETNEILISHLDKVIESIDNETLKDTIEKIKNARRIVIVGTGRSGLVGDYIKRWLYKLGKTVIVVGADNEDIPHRFGKKEGDLVISISGSGTTPTVVSLTTSFRAKGSHIEAFSTKKQGKDVGWDTEKDVINILPGRTKEIEGAAEGLASRRVPLGSLFEYSSMIYLFSIMQCLYEKKCGYKSSTVETGEAESIKSTLRAISESLEENTAYLENQKEQLYEIVELIATNRDSKNSTFFGGFGRLRRLMMIFAGRLVQMNFNKPFFFGENVIRDPAKGDVIILGSLSGSTGEVIRYIETTLERNEKPIIITGSQDSETKKYIEEYGNKVLGFVIPGNIKRLDGTLNWIDRHFKEQEEKQIIPPIDNIVEMNTFVFFEMLTSCLMDKFKSSEEDLKLKHVPKGYELGENLQKHLELVASFDPLYFEFMDNLAIGFFHLLAGIKKTEQGEWEKLLDDETAKARYGDVLFLQIQEIFNLASPALAAKIKISAQEMPYVAPAKDAYCLAALVQEPKTNKWIFIIHKSFLNMLELRGPPEGYSKEEFISLLIQHEIDEYNALNDSWMPIYKEFTSYLSGKERTTENFHNFIRDLRDQSKQNQLKNSNLIALAKQAELLDYAKEVVADSRKLNDFQEIINREKVNLMIKESFRDAQKGVVGRGSKFKIYDKQIKRIFDFDFAKNVITLSEITDSGEKEIVKFEDRDFIRKSEDEGRDGNVSVFGRDIYLRVRKDEQVTIHDSFIEKLKKVYGIDFNKRYAYIDKSKNITIGELESSFAIIRHRETSETMILPQSTAGITIGENGRIEILSCDGLYLLEENGKKTEIDIYDENSNFEVIAAFHLHPGNKEFPSTIDILSNIYNCIREIKKTGNPNARVLDGIFIRDDKGGFSGKFFVLKQGLDLNKTYEKTEQFQEEINNGKITRIEQVSEFLSSIFNIIKITDFEQKGPYRRIDNNNSIATFIKNKTATAPVLGIFIGLAMIVALSFASILTQGDISYIQSVGMVYSEQVNITYQAIAQNFKGIIFGLGIAVPLGLGVLINGGEKLDQQIIPTDDKIGDSNAKSIVDEIKKLIEENNVKISQNKPIEKKDFERLQNLWELAGELLQTNLMYIAVEPQRTLEGLAVYDEIKYLANPESEESKRYFKLKEEKLKPYKDLLENSNKDENKDKNIFAFLKKNIDFSDTTKNEIINQWKDVQEKKDFIYNIEDKSIGEIENILRRSYGLLWNNPLYFSLKYGLNIENLLVYYKNTLDKIDASDKKNEGVINELKDKMQKCEYMIFKGGLIENELVMLYGRDIANITVREALEECELLQNFKKEKRKGEKEILEQEYKDIVQFYEQKEMEREEKEKAAKNVVKIEFETVRAKFNHAMNNLKGEERVKYIEQINLEADIREAIDSTDNDDTKKKLDEMLKTILNWKSNAAQSNKEDREKSIKLGLVFSIFAGAIAGLILIFTGTDFGSSAAMASMVLPLTEGVAIKFRRIGCQSINPLENLALKELEFKVLYNQKFLLNEDLARALIMTAGIENENDKRKQSAAELIEYLIDSRNNDNYLINKKKLVEVIWGTPKFPGLLEQHKNIMIKNAKFELGKEAIKDYEEKVGEKEKLSAKLAIKYLNERRVLSRNISNQMIIIKEFELLSGITELENIAFPDGLPIYLDRIRSFIKKYDRREIIETSGINSPVVKICENLFDEIPSKSQIDDIITLYNYQIPQGKSLTIREIYEHQNLFSLDVLEYFGFIELDDWREIKKINKNIFDVFWGKENIARWIQAKLSSVVPANDASVRQDTKRSLEKASYRVAPLPIILSSLINSVRVFPGLSKRTIEILNNKDEKLLNQLGVLGKSFFEISMEPDIKKTSALNSMGMKALNISLISKREGLLGDYDWLRLQFDRLMARKKKLCNVSVTIDGKNEVIAAYAVKVYLKDGAGRIIGKTWEIRLSDDKISNKDDESRDLYRALLLGRGALAFLNEIRNENKVLIPKLKKLGLDFGKDFSPDVIQMSGASAVFANPKAVIDEYTHKFSKSLFVYEDTDKELYMKAEDASKINLNQNYSKNVVEERGYNAKKLMLLLVDKIIADKTLTRKYKWLEGKINDRKAFSFEGEGIKETIAKIYAPGIASKSIEGITNGAGELIMDVIVSALRGNGDKVDDSIGKISYLEGYAEKELLPAGIKAMNLLLLLNENTPFAGNDNLINQNMKQNDNVAEFEKYVADEKNKWLAKAVEKMDQDKAELFKTKQWLFSKQLGETLANLHNKEIKVILPLVVDINNAEQAKELLDAVEYWLDFGIDGFKLNIKGAKSFDEDFADRLVNAVRRSALKSKIFLKLDEKMTEETINKIRQNDEFVIVSEENKLQEGDGMELTSFPDGTTDLNKDMESYIDKIRFAILSKASSIFLPMWVLYGVKYDLSDRAKMENYRIPREGDTENWKFTADFNKKLKELENIQFANNKNAYERGLNFKGIDRITGWEKVDNIETRIGLPCTNPINSKEVHGRGFHVFLKFCEHMIDDKNSGKEMSWRYWDDERFFNKVQELLSELKAVDNRGKLVQEKEWHTFVDFITNLEIKAASTNDANEKMAYIGQAASYLRGIMENRHKPYAEKLLPGQENEWGRKAIRSILLVGESMGIDLTQLNKQSQEGNLSAIRSFVPDTGLASKDSPKTLFEAIIHINQLMDDKGKADRFYIEGRKTLSPFLEIISKTGTLPESLLGVLPEGKDHEQANMLAINETFRMFIKFIEPRTPTAEDMFKHTIQPAVNAFELMMTAA